jgi:hypothetical protein
VLSVDYRGGTGYGLDDRAAANLGPGGGSERNDLLGAITYRDAVDAYFDRQRNKRSASSPEAGPSLCCDHSAEIQTGQEVRRK